MTPKCIFTLGIALLQKLQMFKPLVRKANKHQIWPHDAIGKILNFRCVKCLHIVHLNLICMSYDQKKGRESNWELTHDHKLEGKGQMSSDRGMLYTVEKIFLKL
jgi:hypothetical protein